VIASALNADVDEIALPYAAKVIRELFLNSAEAGSMGMSTVPLSELYCGAEQFLARTRRRSRLKRECGVGAAWDEETSQWTLATRAGADRGFSGAGAAVRGHGESCCRTCRPADGVGQAGRPNRKARARAHLQRASVVRPRDYELDHAVLLDREIHWMYNKSRLQPWRKTKGSYLELVVSASQKFAALSREEAIELAVRELGGVFPEVAAAKLEKAALVKEVRATFTVPPGIDAARPSATVSPWPNCVLAGDWIATGWPSTMESAARSGHLAAEAVCAAIGEPRKFLNPT
jgi:hypothetical protein